MTPRRMLLLAAPLVLLAVAALTWAWKTWPARQLQSARAALAAGDPARAETLLVPLLKEFPEDPQVPYLQAQALRHLKRYSEAEQAMELATRRGLDRATGMREVALLLAVRDWPPEADGLFQQVLRDRPDDRELLQTLAEGYARRQRWREAVDLYARLVTLYPEELDYVFKRGLARMNDGHYAEAIADFRQVLVLDPAQFPARLYLAHSLQSEARMAEAEVELQTCRKLRPDLVEPLIGLANCAVEKGDLKAAESYLSQAIALDRSSPLVLHQVVDLHLRRQRYDLALEVLLVMARMVPQDKQVHLKLAQIFRREGQQEQAQRHQRIYQELDAREEAQMRGMR